MSKMIDLFTLIMVLSISLGAVAAQDDPCTAELDVMTTEAGVEFVITPDACFENLPDWDYEPQYVEIDGLLQAYVDVGSGESGETILLLHGQPSWSYLYRKMIPVLAEEGHRVIAMDHLGMGRSDKPIDPDYYTYVGHVERLESFIQQLELEQGNLNIFVQDWGSLIGLYVVGTHPDWFNRVVIGDGFLPMFEEGTTPAPLPENPMLTRTLYYTLFTSIPPQQPPFYDEDGNLIMSLGESAGFDLRGAEEARLAGGEIGGGFGIWIDYARNDERFTASQVVEALTYFELTPEERAAYDAPFPSRIAMGGPRAFPGIVNQMPGLTQDAWANLGEFEKPFLTIWAGNDPGNLGQPAVQQALLDHIPGSAGWDHVRLEEASHFLQDDQGEEIARRINAFIEQTAINTIEATDSSLLAYHDGYWVAEVQTESMLFPITMINDMRIDTETGQVTVYAQARIAGNVIAPPQVGPGEFTEHMNGETVGFHPNAVYLNGSGQELDEADGTGAWWVKHSWALNGEGYNNWELMATDYSVGGYYVEGTLLEDGLTMQMRMFLPEDNLLGIPVDLAADEFYGNTRSPILDTNPITYEIVRYEPANIDPEAGPIDLTSTVQGSFVLECREEPSAFDDRVHSCPTLSSALPLDAQEDSSTLVSATDDTYSLDRGTRWLMAAIGELDALEEISDKERESVHNHLLTLIDNPASRLDEADNAEFVGTLQSQEAVEIVERAFVRVSSPLNYHEGYWVAEAEIERVPVPVTMHNDIHVDAYTGRVTVYGQVQVLGRIVAPVQAGPGEVVEHFRGNMLGMHPNAVYLNGRGEELAEADGTGSWWVKYPIMGPEGYYNWVALASDYSLGGQYTEGYLLEDGVTMMLRSFFEDNIKGFPVDNETITEEFFGNSRIPGFETDPITHIIVRYEPANVDPEADPIDYTSTAQDPVVFECRVEPSPFDGLARACPTLD